MLKSVTSKNRLRLALGQRAATAAAGAAFLILSAHQAAAAEANEPVLGDIVVTGIRASLESAISNKQTSDNIIESISAEDIGKLPDTTIAESLTRMPGVTAQRDRNGNATSLNIRGLGPDHTVTLLNGREQTSIGDSRSVDVSVYPPELIAGADVYKTADAANTTAGFAGTVNLKLVDPLAYKKPVFTAYDEKLETAKGLPTPSGTGKRYSATYLDQFADRKLGVALGFVHSDTTSSSLTNGSWGNTPSSITDSSGNKLASVNVPFGGGLGFETDHISDKRDSVVGIVKFNVSDDITTEIDGYHAHIQTGTFKHMLQRGSNGANIINATESGGVVTSGTFQMAPYSLIDRNENLYDDDTLNSIGWNNKFRLSNTWEMSVDLSHNSAERVERDIEVYSGIATADTLSFTNGGSAFPTFTVGNPAAYTSTSTIMVHDVSGWSGVNYPAGSAYAGRGVPQAGYDKGPTTTDTINSGRVDFSVDLGKDGMFHKAEFGVNYTKRTKDRITDEGLLISSGNGGYDPIAYPGGYVENNVGNTGLNMWAYEPTAGLWPGVTLLRKYNDDILSKTWTVKEAVTTAYGKLDISTDWSGIPVRGNVGLQAVHTHQSSGGYRANVNSNVTLTNPAGTLTSAGTSYNDVLPSLNLTAELENQQYVRFATGIEISRPTMTDLRNSLAVSLDTNTGNSTYNTLVGSSGNPNLKPFKADVLDLSYEKYFTNRAYFSAAVYYKHLASYIANATNYGGYDFSSIGPAVGLAQPAKGWNGTFTTPVNGSGGNVHGIELAGSFPLDMVSDWLTGFGVYGSISDNQSSINLPNLIGLNPNQQVSSSAGTMPLPGLSKTDAKISLYYERSGFSAAWYEGFRSQYVGSVANTTTGGYPTLIYVEPQHWVSAQIGYQFQSTALKGLGIRFEGNNLNKPVYTELKSLNPVQTNTTNATGSNYAFKVFYRY